MNIPTGDIYAIDGYDRKLMKGVAMIALNSKRSNGNNPYHGVIRSIQENLSCYGKITYKEAKDALQAFMVRHRGIANHLCSDFGVKAMYYDALIIEDCLRELMVKKSIIVLPVHDELLCPADKVEVVKEQMVKSYRKILWQALVKNKMMFKTEVLPDTFVPVIKSN